MFASDEVLGLSPMAVDVFTGLFFLVFDFAVMTSPVDWGKEPPWSKSEQMSS